MGSSFFSLRLASFFGGAAAAADGWMEEKQYCEERREKERKKERKRSLRKTKTEKNEKEEILWFFFHVQVVVRRLVGRKLASLSFLSFFPLWVENDEEKRKFPFLFSPSAKQHSIVTFVLVRGRLRETRAIPLTVEKGEPKVFSQLYVFIHSHLSSRLYLAAHNLSYRAWMPELDFPAGALISHSLCSRQQCTVYCSRPMLSLKE